jgi:hypothetical protein
MKKFLRLAPRILVIIYICFISMFAFDVFAEYAFPEVLVALFMHLIPSFALLALLAVAWKRPRLGGALFLILAIFFTIFFKLYEDFIVFLIIGLPVYTISILFLLNSNDQKTSS